MTSNTAARASSRSGQDGPSFSLRARANARTTSPASGKAPLDAAAGTADFSTSSRGQGPQSSPRSHDHFGVEASATKNVVVLGGSYGGMHAATVLAQRLPPSHRVVLIERNSHFNREFP